MRAPVPGHRLPPSGFRAARALVIGHWSLVVGHFLCLCPGSRADIQDPPRAHAPGEQRVQRRGAGVASPVGQAVEVEEGGRVEIILQAHGPVGKSLAFLIRRPPAHGALLGEPRAVSAHAAAVTYAHQPGDAAGQDDFDFAVQAPGGGVSAPETVSIAVRLAPARLVATPAELDFGTVTAGEATGAEFTLENQGGAEAAGRVEPPLPWTVEGAAEYRLPHGASQTFRLVFRPPGEQAFTESLHFRAELEGSPGVRLVGTGLPNAAQIAAARERRAAAAERTRQAGAQTGAAPAAASGPAVATLPAAGSASGPAASAPPVARAASAADLSAPGPGGDLAPGEVDGTRVSTNEARVERFEIAGRGVSTLDLAWRPPAPRPKSYRVELRYLSQDPEGKLRVDWRPYALVDLRAADKQVTAHVHGLPAGTRQTLRVVAVDAAGELAAPSATDYAETLAPSTWWHPTLLKFLLLLLALCGGLAWQRRRENRQILRELDENRVRRNRAAEVAG